MTEIFFYLFAAIAVVPAVYLVVFSRNAVNSAMCLIVTFIGMAGLFVLLEAYFIAVIQVLVYAGAVVVLFLFIIMLLDENDMKKAKKVKPLGIVAGSIGFLIALSGVVAVVSSDAVTKGHAELPKATGAALKPFGYELFTTYLLPMQVTGFLLLTAMIGVIVLSKQTKDEAQ